MVYRQVHMEGQMSCSVDLVPQREELGYFKRSVFMVDVYES